MTTAWLVSAKSEQALRGQAERLHGYLERHPELELGDVAYTLATARAQLEWRAAVVGAERDDLLAGLEAIERGDRAPGGVQGSTGDGKTAFMFTGQGSQWPGMGAVLYRTFPAFAEALNEVGAEFDRHLERPLREVMFAPADADAAALLTDTRFAQPALFAVEVGLCRLVEGFGVVPDFLVGHSVGELVAAFVAGVFSLEDACRVVAARGRLMGALPVGGAMVSVAASEDEVRGLLVDGLSIAAVNGPRATVVSGSEGVVEGFVERVGFETTRLRTSHAFHSELIEPMLAEFERVLAGVSFGSPRVPVVSNVTGELLSEAEAASPAYWVTHAREAVRFADGLGTLEALGVRRFLELGPDRTLAALAGQCVGLREGAREPLVVSSLRGRKVSERGALLGCLAAAHCDGVDVEWAGVLAGGDLGRVELPTYAFQRERYWLAPGPGVGDVGAAGLVASDHPLLGAAVRVAGGDEWLFTGRVSVGSDPWLRDHAVLGAVLLPGSAFVELALAAARSVDAGGVEQLDLVAPLVLGDGPVALQVAVGELDERGRRAVSVYSCPQADEQAGWTLHASGLLGAGAERPAVEFELESFAGQEWPPAGAEELDVEALYEQAAVAGYEYGPAFQGLRRAFRVGDVWFAEVALERELEGRADGFCVHPALSDAALHALLFDALERDGADPAVPFSFSGVRVLAEGAAALRVRVERVRDGDGDAVRLLALDGSGEPALVIEALRAREVDRAALAAQAGGVGEWLLGLEWVPAPPAAPAEDAALALLGQAPWTAGSELACYPDPGALAAAVEAGAALPSVVLARAAELVAGDGLVEAAQGAAERTLELLQSWLACERLSEARLVLVTDRAVAVAAGESPNLEQAALVGLVRSAASENPGRVAVLDLDQGALSAEPLQAAVASAEPELALRGGELYAPRLARARVEDRDPVAAPAQGTVLITGGTGGLGALVARHLAGQGVEHMVLASRRGSAGEGVQELVDALGELGCQARVAACDAADRAQLEAVIAAIPPERPLRMVVHAAGVLDDGVIGSLDGERLRRVMAPKVAGAINLHELTRELELSEFVLFSSLAATVGGAGQGNYAAANAFLDALAHQRRAHGLPGLSLAWGVWERGMAAGLGASERARTEQMGVLALTDDQGLALLDAARGSAQPLLVPARLDPGALRAQAHAGMLPAILQGLVRVPARRAVEGSLARRLAAAPESDWPAIVLELVRADVASVLGHSSADAIELGQNFKDLGFDSLSAVELRNRLAQATGLRLPATLVFDHPTPAAVAEFVHAQAAGAERAAPTIRRARARLEEPIAIVGMSARYPGGVHSPDELWQLVAEGRDATGEFPTDRGWDLDGLYDPDPDHTGTTYTRRGGFLYDAGDFDCELFSISPREALAMDPQHRLMLEASWEAFEDAGIDPTGLKGSQTGVFTGIMYQDYGTVGRKPPELEGLFGTGGSLLSGRLAYSFGLEGPAVSIDTACSSSLVAIHLACQALRQGECELALAGGVTVLATPTVFVEFARQRGLSPDGRCKSFGEDADGVAWAEGAGLLVLERLSAPKPPATTSSRWCAAARSTKTAPATDSPPPTAPAKNASSAKPSPTPASPPKTSTPSKRTAPAPPSATRSKPKPCWPPTAKTAPTARSTSARSNPTSATPKPPPASAA